MDLEVVHDRLGRSLKDGPWWPAESPLEVLVGALVVHQTTWSSVEQALERLRDRDLLSLSALAACPLEVLETCLRPVGFYRVKARRLRAMMRAIQRDFGRVDPFLARPPAVLREHLLSFRGVGPETADAILLYAATIPVLLIDDYTRRILTRLGMPLPARYGDAQAAVQARLPRDTAVLQTFHAGMVEVGKRYCRPTPHCAPCPLLDLCPHGQAVMAESQLL